jgi:hypothetical protein
MDGLRSWRQWLLTVAYALRNGLFALAEFLMNVAMLRLFIWLAATRGMLITV